MTYEEFLAECRAITGWKLHRGDILIWMKRPEGGPPLRCDPLTAIAYRHDGIKRNPGQTYDAARVLGIPEAVAGQIIDAAGAEWGTSARREALRTACNVA